MAQNGSNALGEYIGSLCQPVKAHKAERKQWGIGLESVWIPMFHATNLEHKTFIPSDALGAPLRLGYEKDGTVKLSASGRPVIRVVKEVQLAVGMIRQNFEANCVAYTKNVRLDNPDGYKTEVAKAQKAGEPIIQHDAVNLRKHAEMLQAQADAARAEAARVEAAKVAKAKADKAPKARKPTARKPDVVIPEVVTIPVDDRELVAA